MTFDRVPQSMEPHKSIVAAFAMWEYADYHQLYVILTTENDAKTFLDTFDEFVVRFDPLICHINGGSTHYRRRGKDTWQLRSAGQNWWDRGWSEISHERMIDVMKKTAERSEGNRIELWNPLLDEA